MAKTNLLQDSLGKINWALDKIISGESALHLVESGVSVFIDQNRSTAVKPKTRAVVALNPTASILIKKKAFSTMKATNDLRWMGKSEKMLIRATKALFAFKVAQLRAYESLTKLDKFYDDNSELNFTLLADLISSSKYLQPAGAPDSSGSLLSILGGFVSSAGVSGSTDDIIKIIRRNAFATANTKTTWIVDPDDVENYGTGPGTGVIELCTWSNLNTTTGITSDSKQATFGLVDPYRIMNVIEDDIEMCIEEALYGTLGLMNDLAYAGMGGEYIDPTLIVSSALEVFGLGGLDPTIDVDYIRDRLRTFYLGKWIANVNDGVHIFIAGNKSVTSNSHLGNDAFDSSLDESYFQVDEVILEAERKLYTNQNISSSSYRNLRKYSNNSFTMQHVFGGFIKSISESYSPDKTMLTVTCSDNMGWLANSRFMEEPGLIDPRAPLEDPLTPYDIKTISSSNPVKTSQLDLLPENKLLLKSGLLSFDSGLLTGFNANETNIYQGQYAGSGTALGSKIVQHPSGLIYRWRSGVLAVVAPFSATGDSSSAAASAQSPSSIQQYGFSVTSNVVANLDVANVISVMITGQPYNMETFTQLAGDAMNVMRVGNSYQPNEALSFVLDSIRKQNPFYGNFKPFRMITMSEQTLNRLSGDSFVTDDVNSKVAVLRRRKNELKRKIRILEGGGNERSNAAIINMLKQEITSIENSTSSQVQSIYKNNGVFGGTGINAADLLDTNFNIFGQNQVLKSGGNIESDHDLTRAMMKVAATRRIEDVKLNRDQNLLIVSDQYDMNPDIKAYVLNMRTSNFQMFKGTYLPVYDRCKTAAEVTMMEFFANSQGHLEIRPPQYNKTPLSVLNALYKYQNTTDRKVVPDFLFTMLNDRTSSLKLEIHAKNVKIVIIAMLLGKFPDSNLIPGVTATGASSFAFFGISTGNTTLLDGTGLNVGSSTGSNVSLDSPSNILGNIDTSENYIALDLGSSEEGDILNGDTSTTLGNFDNIVREFGGGASSYQVIPGASIYDDTLGSLLNANKSLNTNSSVSNPWSAKASDTVNGINNIIAGFRQASGINPAQGIKASGPNGTFQSSDLLFSGISSGQLNSGSLESRLDELFSELDKTISSRNSLIGILKKNQEKQEELDRIEADLANGFSEDNTDFWEDPAIAEQIDNIYPTRKGDSAKTSATKSIAANAAKFIFEAGRTTKRTIDATKDFLSGTATEGTLFDHLIDDDTRNLLGPGSGRRFIINDEQIQSYTINENKPQFSRIDIFGTTPLVTQQLKSTTGGENLIQWAGAVDYDLWRQYGYIPLTIQDAPFISDAETQAKPLALQQLAVQRTAIFTGSCQLAGNEYYQPGDTVYIPSKGLLFYVNSVTHSMTYGQSFSTNLMLTNGHVPGTYLPTPMDVIGQSYSKDCLTQDSYYVKRSTSTDDNYHPLQPDCALRFPTLPKITSDNVEYLLSHKNNMVKFYNMITDVSNGLLTSGRLLLIRGFVRDDGDEPDVKEKLSIVSELFQNPSMLSQKLDTSAGDDLVADFLQPSQSLFNINAGSGSNKELTSMTLPNSLPVTKVQADQIFLQVVKLKRDDIGETVGSGFSCFSAANLRSSTKLFNVKNGDSEITSDDIATTFYSVLPKGGPSQSTWLEMEDLLQSIFSSSTLGTTGDYEKVIEVGILDIDSAMASQLKALK